MVSTQPPFRISVWDTTGNGRGRGKLKAVISDAKYIGVSSFLNEGGEAFFTLPYNHPQVNECDPLTSHYSVERLDPATGIYLTVGNGLINDFVATDDEVVFYGIDYMTVLNQTLTSFTSTTIYNNVTYSSQILSSIVTSELFYARTASNSRLGFISVETPLHTTGNTYTMFTAAENRTDFLRNACAIAQAGTTKKVVFGNRIETTSQSYNSFFLDMNYQSAVNNKLTLSYGGNVKRFSYSPNFKSLRTNALVISTNVGYASVAKLWSSVATSALTSTYGLIERADIRQDVLSATGASYEIDNLSKQVLYESSPDKIKEISVSVVDGAVIPFKDYVLGDDIRVIIKRGLVDINTNLTLRGQQWIGREDGSESITFDFFNRNQISFEVSPYKSGSAVASATGATSHAKPTIASGIGHTSAKPNHK